MSLELSYDAPTGVTHANAYHKITSLNHRRENNVIMIHVTIYKDAAAKKAEKACVGTSSYRVANSCP